MKKVFAIVVLPAFLAAFAGCRGRGGAPASRGRPGEASAGAPATVVTRLPTPKPPPLPRGYPTPRRALLN